MKIMTELFGNRRFLLYLCTVNQNYETDTTDTQIIPRKSRVLRAYMRYARKYINYLLYLLSVTYQCAI